MACRFFTEPSIATFSHGNSMKLIHEGHEAQAVAGSDQAERYGSDGSDGSELTLSSADA